MGYFFSFFRFSFFLAMRNLITCIHFFSLIFCSCLAFLLLSIKTIRLIRGLELGGKQHSAFTP